MLKYVTFCLLILLVLSATACSSGGDETSTPIPTDTNTPPTTVPTSESASAPEGTSEPENAEPPVFGVGFDQNAEGPLSIVVDPDGPAYRAGMRDGDVITALNDQAVTLETISTVFLQFSAGDTIKVSVLRNDEPLDFNVTLEARNVTSVREETSVTQPFLGVVLTLGLEDVTIQEVMPESAADKAGLQVGDTLLTANGISLDEPTNAYDAILDLMPGDELNLLIERDGETLGFAITLTEPVNDTPPVEQGPAADSVVFLEDEGVWVIESAPESGLVARYGLQTGDRVTAINGEVYTPQELFDLVPQTLPTDKIVFTVERDGEEITVEGEGAALVTLAGAAANIIEPFQQAPSAQQPQFPQIMTPPANQDTQTEGALPPFVQTQTNNQTTTPDIPALFQSPPSALGVIVGTARDTGVFVEQVIPASPADSAGIQIGDIITAVDGQEIREETEFDAALAELEGSTVTLSVLRGEETIELQVELETSSGELPVNTPPPFLSNPTPATEQPFPPPAAFPGAGGTPPPFLQTTTPESGD